jgi:hypothetical protein
MVVLLQCFSKAVDKEGVILLAARASRVENQDAIDAAIVGMLADPQEVSSHSESLWPFEKIWSDILD